MWASAATSTTTGCPARCRLFERTLALAEIPTRLDGLPDELQERLINWGYAVGDAGLRKHLDEAARRRPGFPYPDAGV